MKDLIFITGNLNKLEEARKILPEFNILQEDTDLPEVQELNAEVIIREKIRTALKLFDKPVFVEDTSLYLDELNGLPGPLIKWFIKSIHCRGIVDMLSAFKNKSAKAACLIGYGEPPNKILVFKGEIKGEIVEPRGETKFGWDPIFQPIDSEDTFAEMSKVEKNKISHRAKAFQAFKEYLTTK